MNNYPTFLEYYSNTGPLHVETDWFPLVDAWLRSGEEVGFNIGDPNGHQREGLTTADL